MGTVSKKIADEAIAGKFPEESMQQFLITFIDEGNCEMYSAHISQPTFELAFQEGIKLFGFCPPPDEPKFIILEKL